MNARKALQVLVVLSLLGAFYTINVLSSGSPAPDLAQVLRQETGGNARISYHAETGKVRFIGTDPAHPMSQPSALAEEATPEAAAFNFMATYGSLFGLSDPAQALSVMRTRTMDDGRSMVRFQQAYQGIPVLGGEMIVNMDAARNVLSANGEALPDIKVNTVPALEAETARQIALEKIAKDNALEVDDLVATQPELWIYNPVLLGGTGPKITSLVWRMDVQAKELLPIRELVLVDAHLGAVVLHFNQIDTAKNRTIFDNNNTPSDDLSINAAVCTEGNCSGSGNDYNFAYNFAGDTYDYYLANHSRDSLNGSGMGLISTVRYCPLVGGCPYQNAFWNGEQMVYGQNFASADDIVAHEMTHGVTEHESHLFYYRQSGGINESFSDIWGEFVDQANSYSGTGGSTPWLVGEDLTGFGAARSMSNPPAYGDPDMMSSANYFCGDDDNGGVHYNSGVSNKAAYLMAAGGTFNTYTITALGIPKTAKIFYEVQTNLFTSASDYQDLYDGLQQACTNLVGTAGITALDCLEVKDAVDATQMNLQPASCATSHAPVCPAGQTPNTIFFDNLENFSSGNWSSGAVNGTANHWYYPQNTHPFTGFDATYASSGIYNFWGYDLEATGDYAISKNANVNLPPASTPYLHFEHAYAFEDGNWDGGVIEYSVNGGAWTDAGALPAVNGYTGSIQAGGTNPLQGRPGFVNDSNGYISTRLNLSSLAGSNVRFRFRIGTDVTSWDWGWFIDDIRIYTCVAAGPLIDVYVPQAIRGMPPQAPPAAPSNLVATASSSSAIHLAWSDIATNEDGYNLERSPNGSSWSPLITLPANSSSYDNTGLPASTPFHYRVNAYNGGGSSAWSNAASATTMAASGPTPGFWESATGDEFYVTPNGAYVDNFSIYITVSGCGNYKITHLNPEDPISSNQFSFTGAFYASGTFDSQTTAHGSDGLNNFNLIGCGPVSGGPWSYTANWVNATQPPPDFQEAVLVQPGDGNGAASPNYHVVELDR